jgi:hypothetical protein
MSAGYSKRPLSEKLGIKEGTSVLILNAPVNYDKSLKPLPEKISRAKKLKKSLEFIQIFTTEKQQLLREFPRLKSHLAPKGILWISWPKGASKVKTDLNENIVRQIGLANGMVDIKVCAVDEVWSGLRFAFRRS